jgi:hypothetical protein
MAFAHPERISGLVVVNGAGGPMTDAELTTATWVASTASTWPPARFPPTRGSTAVSFVPGPTAMRRSGRSLTNCAPTRSLGHVPRRRSGPVTRALRRTAVDAAALAGKITDRATSAMKRRN